MFHQIRRHQKWLWIVISAAVIISFVIYFTPDADVTLRGVGRTSYGYINNRPVTLKELQAALREAQLKYLFTYGNWPGNDDFGREMGYDVEREAENRLFLAEKVRELNIQVSEDEVADWIAEAFADRKTMAFRPEAFDQFVKGRLAERGMVAADFREFVRLEVAVGHLVQVAGLSGKLVPPREAEAQYRRENEQLTASVVTFQQSNYLATVTIDPLALQVFYTNRMSIYRLPERVSVTFVKFDATNFLAEADTQIAKQTNYAQQVDAEYMQRGPDNFKDPAGQVLAPDVAKLRIRSEHRTQLAEVGARRKAAAFVEEVLAAFEADPKQTNLLETMAPAKGLTAVVSAPFTQRDGPREMRTLTTFSQVAFKLSAEEPYSNPIPDEEAVYVISLKQRLPSENPPWDTVKDRVTEEYRRGQALEAARNAGKALLGTLTNGLAAGRPFEELCAEAKVTALKLPPFSLGTRTLPEAETNRVSLPELKNTASALAQGKVSPLLTTRDGSMLVFLHAKAPADEAKLKLEIPTYVQTLRESAHFEAFQEWFRKEKEAARITGLPLQKNRKETAE